MQFHQGSRLKNLIEKSRITQKEISEKAKIAASSLNDLFKKDEILPSRIEKILEVINVSSDQFYKVRSNNLNDDGGVDFLSENAQLRQIINLLKRQVDQQEEVITLLKKRKLTV